MFVNYLCDGVTLTDLIGETFDHFFQRWVAEIFRVHPSFFGVPAYFRIKIIDPFGVNFVLFPFPVVDDGQDPPAVDFKPGDLADDRPFLVGK